MNEKMYIEFVKGVTESDGLQVADILNKTALQAEEISRELFDKAARAISDEFMKRG